MLGLIEQRKKTSYGTVFTSGLEHIGRWAGRTNGAEGSVVHVGGAGATRNALVFCRLGAGLVIPFRSVPCAALKYKHQICSA